MQTAQDERSLGELFAELSQETNTLIRQEMNLAKTEMTQKAARAGKGIGLLVAGGAVVYAGFLALVATEIIALAYAIPWWLAALIIGILVVGLGGLLLEMGRESLTQTDFAPRRTLRTLQRDLSAIKGDKS